MNRDRCRGHTRHIPDCAACLAEVRAVRGPAWDDLFDDSFGFGAKGYEAGRADERAAIIELLRQEAAEGVANIQERWESDYAKRLAGSIEHEPEHTIDPAMRRILAALDQETT
jgi:hypothetical protein